MDKSREKALETADLMQSYGYFNTLYYLEIFSHYQFKAIHGEETDYYRCADAIGSRQLKQLPYKQKGNSQVPLLHIFVKCQSYLYHDFLQLLQL